MLDNEVDRIHKRISNAICEVFPHANPMHAESDVMALERIAFTLEALVCLNKSLQESLISANQRADHAIESAKLVTQYLASLKGIKRKVSRGRRKRQD